MLLALFSIFEAGLIACSLSVDAFAAGFAYGAGKTKIPLSSAMIINLICSAVIGFMLLTGALLQPYLPAWLALALSFAILLIIGLIKLLDSITKSIIRKHTELNKEFNFKLLNFKFVLHLYANLEAADLDASKTLSGSEAALLALSLSLDGAAVGFGAGLAGVNVPALILWTLVTDLALLFGGHFLGRKIVQKTKLNLSWLSGVVLIALAISKFF